MSRAQYWKIVSSSLRFSYNPPLGLNAFCFSSTIEGHSNAKKLFAPSPASRLFCHAALVGGHDPSHHYLGDIGAL